MKVDDVTQDSSVTKILEGRMRKIADLDVKGGPHFTLSYFRAALLLLNIMFCLIAPEARTNSCVYNLS